MAGEVRRIILLPRYTTLVGPTTFLTAPLNIREFAMANIVVWRGTAIGTMNTFTVKVQQSPDLTTWSDLGSALAPSADSEDSDDFTFTMDWLRLRVEVSEPSPGGEPAVTCWSLGDFVLREG